MAGVLACADNPSAEEWEGCWGLADQPSLTDLWNPGKPENFSQKRWAMFAKTIPVAVLHFPQAHGTKKHSHPFTHNDWISKYINIHSVVIEKNKYMLQF